MYLKSHMVIIVETKKYYVLKATISHQLLRSYSMVT